MYVLGANRMQYLFFSPKRILRFSIFLLHAAVQPGTQRGMGGSFLDACTWALVLHMQFLLTHTHHGSRHASGVHAVHSCFHAGNSSCFLRFFSNGKTSNKHKAVEDCTTISSFIHERTQHNEVARRIEACRSSGCNP